MVATTIPFQNASPPPVNVEVLAESLCIDCQRFFTKSLIPTYNTLGPSVMDLHVIPYGNSRIDYDQKTVTCQHGEAECDANIWEQCAVDKYPAIVYMDFLECLENGVLPMGHREEPFEESVFAQCATESKNDPHRSSKFLRSATVTSMNFAELKACHDDPAIAWSMQKKYSQLTPDHKGVPWVFVDHERIDVDQQDLLQAVCQSYTSKGGKHPACASTSTSSNDDKGATSGKLN